jgi:hypothetical protein
VWCAVGVRGGLGTWDSGLGGVQAEGLEGDGLGGAGGEIGEGDLEGGGVEGSDG